MLIRHLSHGKDFRLNRCPGSVDHYSGTAGGLAGAKMGEEFDSHVLDNYECHHCGIAFSQTEY
ncbi:hypothetical protein CJT92_29880 [Pseudomonas aeruginosa]|nr:hypothetical protein [Pseudomonas aeruginosa]MDV6833439.1 hypothetical protein [Pseudomonas aeruginosa]MDV6948494.1 hypothetical protein [Pseudomonas aeruginosa]PCB24722.1 hypothetical protein CJT92_29880 [Pseudomonas aeruginosa]RQF36570.1 hypothetical protein IPC273_12660 [Pseudomonas aeruginosa]